jgi:hypothetical protein
LIEVGPILRGSSVLVELEYNKPVMARPVDGTPESVEITRAGRTIRVESSPDESLRLALDAIDSHGLMTRDPALLELAVVADAPPEATVLLPSSDEAVLPSATIELIGEGRDDIALTSLELQSRVARPDETSLGGEPAPDPDVEPATIGETDPGLARRAEVGDTTRCYRPRDGSA